MPNLIEPYKTFIWGDTNDNTVLSFGNIILTSWKVGTKDFFSIVLRLNKNQTYKHQSLCQNS